MPEPRHPPFEAGALTTPRQLHRFLDINPQGGKLTRTRKYIVVPVFSVETDWLGYSKIVGEYHYSAPNNFSIQLASLATLPTDTNYSLTISWVDEDNNVYRYSLIRSENDNILVDIPAYDGQLIKKYFRIEIWDTNDTEASETTIINLYTSVLGAYDYRYAQDTELAEDDGLCTGQAYIPSSVDEITADSDLITADDTSITADLVGGIGTFPLPFVWGECAQPVLNS